MIRCSYSCMAAATRTFQFVVDALASRWHVIAPDWRGFGRTHCRAPAYWFPDYLADLDDLLSKYSPTAPVRLVGHSMGGNIVSLPPAFADSRTRIIEDCGHMVHFEAPALLAAAIEAFLRATA